MMEELPRSGAGIQPEAPGDVRSGAGAETAFQAMLKKRQLQESNIEDKVEPPDLDAAGSIK